MDTQQDLLIDQNQINKGKKLLEAACREGNSDIAKILLEEGVEIEVKNKNGNTLLHLASTYNHCDIVKLLLKNGADINIKNNNGNTPLHIPEG